MDDPMASSSSSSSSSSSQTLSTTSFFTPLLISVMGIALTAVIILIYHLLLVKYCIRRRMTFAGEETQTPTGVDEKTLITIPIITYKKLEPDPLSDLPECSVCLVEYDDGDTVRLLPNCKHLFHVKCIDEWFMGHISCPVCRVPVATTVADGGGAVAVEGGGGWSSGRVAVLRHCRSLVLIGERKRFTGMELKRSLSMGQSGCVIVDVNVVDNVGGDCGCGSTIRDESVRGFNRVSSKVKESISWMCVGEGDQGGGLLPC